jgi:hypothetical protein
MTGFSSLLSHAYDLLTSGLATPGVHTACSKRCTRVCNKGRALTDASTESSHWLTLPTFGIPTMPVLRAMLTTEVLQHQDPVLEISLAFYYPSKASERLGTHLRFLC